MKSYSKKRLSETVSNNLECLYFILKFNNENGILFFRITSDLVPFASHEVCDFEWQKNFKNDFRDIGKFIKKTGMRISMHPDQFTLINSPSEAIFIRSIKELEYHSEVLDLMELDTKAKFQIHVGGVYGNKETSIERFIERYSRLPYSVRKRIVLENDDKSYNTLDCLKIHENTGIPVLLDAFHESLNPSPMKFPEILNKVEKTWKSSDGPPMADYSSQKEGGKTGQHAEHIDLKDFKKFLRALEGKNFDVMLEIKDKEKSALKAKNWALKEKSVKNQ